MAPQHIHFKTIAQITLHVIIFATVSGIVENN